MTENEIIQFEPGTLIEHFEIKNEIGNGGYGTVYSVRDKRNNKDYAMKVESRSTQRQGLLQEIEVFERLRTNFFPEFIYNGEDSQYRFLVMELLGPSLSKMRRLLPNNKYIPLSSVRLAYHMLCCIEQLHKEGYVHRDIKPGNFLIKKDPTRTHPIVLTDFGLSKQYLRGNVHIPDQKNQGFVGTYKYSSINAQSGQELSRRDDLISWFYSVIELAESKLPWAGESNKDRTLLLKRTTKPDQLSHNLPVEFASIYNYLIQLKFNEEPDYDRIKNVLNDVLRKVPSPKADINLQAIDLTKNEDAEINYDWELLSDEEVLTISPISLAFEDSSEGEPPPPTPSQPAKNEEQDSCCYIQ